MRLTLHSAVCYHYNQFFTRSDINVSLPHWGTIDWRHHRPQWPTNSDCNPRKHILANHEISRLQAAMNELQQNRTEQPSSLPRILTRPFPIQLNPPLAYRPKCSHRYANSVLAEYRELRAPCKKKQPGADVSRSREATEPSIALHWISWSRSNTIRAVANISWKLTLVEMCSQPRSRNVCEQFETSKQTHQNLARKFWQ